MEQEVSSDATFHTPTYSHEKPSEGRTRTWMEAGQVHRGGLGEAVELNVKPLLPSFCQTSKVLQERKIRQFQCVVGSSELEVGCSDSVALSNLCRLSCYLGSVGAFWRGLKGSASCGRNLIFRSAPFRPEMSSH